MRPVAPFVFLVITLSFLVPLVPAEARPDPTGTAHDDTEADAIRAAALDYIEGWYAGDAERMERSLHPHLAKRFVEEIAEGGVRLTETSALQLVQQVRRGGGSGTPTAERRADVRILDVFQDVASVRVDAHAWIDYMHLAKWRGEWKIVNVLWEIRDREASAIGSCEPVEGIEDLPTDPVLLFGELHGTDRGPAAFGAVVCHLAREHAELTVGLEISHREQERIDAFLSSDGTKEDRQALLSGPFWTDEYQDGRRSRAMVELLETLRALRRAGTEIGVVAFDPLPDAAFAEREGLMARHLVDARRRAPETPLLALVGNLHPRTVRVTRGSGSFVPMGARIEEAGLDVLPIDVRHAGGSAWLCTGSSAADCGPRQIGGGDDPRDVPLLELFSEPEEGTGYAGVLRVGAVKSSPPAVGPRSYSKRSESSP